LTILFIVYILSHKQFMSPVFFIQIGQIDMLKRTVLIAENDGIISLDIKNILKSIDLKSVIAISEKELLERYKTENPDLIIADLFLSNISNEKILREISRNNGTPIIIITGSSKSKVEKIARTLPNCSYLQKPFDKAELLELVKRYTGGKGHRGNGTAESG